MSVGLYPLHWPHPIAGGSKIEVSNEVFTKLKEDFQESIQKPVEIISIRETCNHDFFDRYKRFDYFLVHHISGVTSNMVCLIFCWRKIATIIV